MATIEIAAAEGGRARQGGGADFVQVRSPYLGVLSSESAAGCCRASVSPLLCGRSVIVRRCACVLLLPRWRRRRCAGAAAAAGSGRLLASGLVAQEGDLGHADGCNGAGQAAAAGHRHKRRARAGGEGGRPRGGQARKWRRQHGGAEGRGGLLRQPLAQLRLRHLLRPGLLRRHLHTRLNQKIRTFAYPNAATSDAAQGLALVSRQVLKHARAHSTLGEAPLAEC